MDNSEITDNMVFRPSTRRSPKEVKLRHLEWAVVTQLDGEKTVSQVAMILALSKQETDEIFINLKNEGLIELLTVSQDDAVVPKNIVKEIEHELTLLVGPVADIILGDIIQKIKKKPDKLEKNDLPVIIDLLTNHITDPQKQSAFQINIYPKVKKYLI